MEIYRPLIAQSHGPLDAILQFAHISRPVILQQGLHGGGRDLNRCAPSVTLQKPMGQHGDIGAAFAQGGQAHGHHVQAEVEVLAERAVTVFGFEIAVGGGNHAHIDLHLLIAAHGPNFFLL